MTFPIYILSQAGNITFEYLEDEAALEAKFEENPKDMYCGIIFNQSPFENDVRNREKIETIT